MEIKKSNKNIILFNLHGYFRAIYRYLYTMTLVLCIALFIFFLLIMSIFLIVLFINYCIPFFTVNIRLMFWISLITSGLLIFAVWNIKIKTAKSLKNLEQVKEQMQKLVDPKTMYSRLGIDILSFQFNEKLLIIADPEQEGQLLPKVAALRQILTDQLGYIIPNIRIMDNLNLNNNEYNILVRNIIVGRGVVYPNKLLITQKEADTKMFVIPEKAIEGIDPISQEQSYWVDYEDVDKESLSEFRNPYDIIISHIRSCVIRHADEIINLDSTSTLVNCVKENSPVCVENLIPKYISIVDLQKIIVNLTKEQVSIIDIIYIFEKLCDFARFTNNPDILSEKLRVSLSKHICNKYADKNNILYAVNVPEYIKHILTNSEHQIDNQLKSDELNKLTAFITSVLDKSKETTDKKPVVLCPRSIRLSLYRLASQHFPEIAILSTDEIADYIKVELINLT